MFRGYNVLFDLSCNEMDLRTLISTAIKYQQDNAAHQ